MDRQAMVNELTALISDYLKNRGLILVDLTYRYEGRNLFLRVLIDRPEGGINLSECADINNQLGRLLDEKDILRQKYILEVSSPGLDRPLKTESDFLRCLNRKARFFLQEEINGKIELAGLISKVEKGRVYIDTEGNLVEIPLAKINKAKQILEY